MSAALLILSPLGFTFNAAGGLHGLRALAGRARPWDRVALRDGGELARARIVVSAEHGRGDDA